MKRVFRKLIAAALLLCMLTGTVACNIVVTEDTGSEIEISEVVLSNGESYVDEAYGSPDWIELHNTGEFGHRSRRRNLQLCDDKLHNHGEFSAKRWRCGRWV